MSAKQVSNETGRMIRRRRRVADDAPATTRSLQRMLAPGAPGHATAAGSRHNALRALQSEAGNQLAQRALAQRAAGDAVARDTDFGTFLVAAEGHPVPSARDPERDIPITQKVYDRLREVIDLLKGGSTEIELKGDGAFRASVLVDLAWVFRQPQGRDLLKAVASSGKQLTIEYAQSGGLRAVAEADAGVRPDGTPGPGSDVELRYLPKHWSFDGNLEAFERREPAQGLARSLVEMIPLLNGTAPSRREREQVAGNLQATGMDQLKQLIQLENRFRAAFSMPVRPEE
jgi:hypothetical protein